jgi:hypothetical protein
MQNPLTDRFISDIVSKVIPEAEISNAGIIYIQQLLNPYYESMKNIPDNEALLKWVGENLAVEGEEELWYKRVKSEIESSNIDQNIMLIFDYFISDFVKSAAHHAHGHGRISPWDIKNVLVQDEESAKKFGFPFARSTFPVTVLINGQSFIHDMTKEFAMGLYHFILTHDQDWKLYVLNQRLHFVIGDDEMNIDNGYEDYPYSVQIHNQIFYLTNLDFIQGWSTGATWANVDPYSELLDFSSYNKDGQKTPLEFILPQE